LKTQKRSPKKIPSPFILVVRGLGGKVSAEKLAPEERLERARKAAKFKLLPEDDKRVPYPLNWEDQFRLFNELPSHLAKMALFKVDPECREQKVSNLRWEWKIEVPEPETSVFSILAGMVKIGKSVSLF
jgi:hypothetical protein